MKTINTEILPEFTFGGSHQKIYERDDCTITTNMLNSIPKKSYSNSKEFVHNGVEHRIDKNTLITTLKVDEISIVIDIIGCHSTFRKGTLVYDIRPTKNYPKETLDELINRPGNRRKLTKWTEAELYILNTCLEANIRERYIAMILGRGRISVERRAQRMGIFPKGKRI